MKFIYAMLIPLLGFSTSSVHATPASTDGPKMTITTSNEIGTELSYFYTVNSDDAWIDLNNNGQFDQGEKLLSDTDDATYTIQSQTLNIYGSVTTFMPSYMDLTAIDVSGNPDLELLDCSNNQLTSLDVSKNTNLTALWCYNNELTSLNLTGLTKLESLNCSKNKLNSIILDQCPNLETITLKVNELPGNVTKAIIDQLPNRTDKKGKFIAIDTQNSKDKNIFYKSDIAIAKAKNWKVTDSNNGEPIEYDGIEEPTTPSSQYADVNGPSATIVVKNIEQTMTLGIKDQSSTLKPWADLNANGTFDQGEELEPNNLYQDLTLTNATLKIYGDLVVLNIINHEIQSVEVSKAVNLKKLDLHGDNIETAIDLSQNTNLENIDLSNNSLPSINVANCAKIKKLIINNNKLTSLDLSACSALEHLNASNNELTSVGLPTNATMLKKVFIQVNKINAEEMHKVIDALPQKEAKNKGTIYVIDTKSINPADENICTKSSVVIATDKNWEVKDWNGVNPTAYNGSDDAPQVHYAPVDGPMISLNFSTQASNPITLSTSTVNDDDNLIAWADLNSNGHFDEGEILVNGKNKITVDNQSVNLYGNFTKLEAKTANITAINLTKATAIDTLNLFKNALTELDLSQNINLKSLDVVNNELTSLDLSHNLELASLNCAMNKLTALNLSQNENLIFLSAYKNELTSITLNPTADSKLNKVVINSNKINASEMEKIIKDLPERSAQDGAMIIVINTKDQAEGNVCTTKDVAIAKGKNWMIKDFNGSIKNMVDYEGSQDPAGLKTITPTQVCIYPTYIQDQFTVKVPTGYLDGNLNLYDLNGHFLQSTKINATTMKISICNLPNGIYFVKVGEVVKRIVKQ